jgi:hypothetical protein
MMFCPVVFYVCVCIVSHVSESQFKVWLLFVQRDGVALYICLNGPMEHITLRPRRSIFVARFFPVTHFKSVQNSNFHLACVLVEAGRA